MLRIVSTEITLTEGGSDNTRILKVIEGIMSTISHELHNSLLGVTGGASGIKHKFSALVNGYKLAQKHHLEGLEPISPQSLDILSTTPEVIQKEAESCKFCIDYLLYNIAPRLLRRDPEGVQKISYCIALALESYPFTNDSRALVHWQGENEFSFWGSELPLRYALFNLLRNALYQIKKAGKGDITVWQSTEKDANVLHFKDTASGVAKDIIPTLFQPFNSDKRHGLGLGLLFCSRIMNELGGRIECDSIEGESCEFLLYFPKIRQQ